MLIENASLIEKINKIISNAVVLIASRVMSNGTISIVVERTTDDKTLIKIAISTNEPLKAILLKSQSNQLDTKNINAYFLLLLLKSYNAIIDYPNDNVLSVTLTK